MLKVNVLGATSLIGHYFVDNNCNYKLVCFSRQNKNGSNIDLQNEGTFENFCCDNSFLVSFAPIWLVKNLFINFNENNASKLRTLKGVIIYSSSSAITKKFAANVFDKNLSKELLSSEKIILSICKKYSISCIVIRPTIVYGFYKGLNDKNYTGIINFFQKIPFCLIPSVTGYRQPIHFSELSELTFSFLDKLNKSYSKDIISKIVEVGGDEELTYSEILYRLAKLSSKQRIKRCKLIPIPNRIFYILIAPFLFFKPKLFEEIYRMQSDFSGFTKCSEYTGKKLKKFPLQNFQKF